jgi:hypothetical protein
MLTLLGPQCTGFRQTSLHIIKTNHPGTIKTSHTPNPASKIAPTEAASAATTSTVPIDGYPAQVQTLRSVVQAAEVVVLRLLNFQICHGHLPQGHAVVVQPQKHHVRNPQPRFQHRPTTLLSMPMTTPSVRRKIYASRMKV